MFPYKIIDLTHTVNSQIPLWPGSDPFSMKIRFDYHEVGCRAAAYSFIAATGTHMDAPAHFIKGGKTVDQIALKDLIAPLCIIDVQQNVKNNPDYTLQIDDILAWEARNREIPQASVVVMNTGWWKRWPDLKSFVNADTNGNKHFPGFSKEAAQFLLQRKIVGIGIDTFSLDAGIAATFPVHHLMLGKGIYFLECLANLDQVAMAGAFICALPPKIENAPEIPLRVIALIPQ